MVYVISKSGKPLMPTNRHGKVRILLKNKLAKVVQNKRQFLPPPKRWGYPCPKMMKKDERNNKKKLNEKEWKKQKNAKKN